MSDILKTNKEIKAVLQQAERELTTDDTLPFSPPAYSLLKWKIAEYISDLVVESVKVSKRHQADTVSAAHVEQASAYLVSSTSRRIFRHLGTIGGILLGSAISNILAMTIANQYTATNTLISVILGIVGAFLIALYMAKE
jgi:hypothetical protein